MLRIDDQPMDKVAQLRNLVAASYGRKVKVEYVRDGKRATATVALTEQPSDEEMAAVSPSAGDTGALGLKVAPVDKAARQKYDLPADLTHGVVVTAVSPNSAAAEIGLQPGDVILQLNRTAIRSAKQLEQTYKAAKGKLAMLLYRDGSTVYVVLSK